MLVYWLERCDGRGGRTTCVYTDFDKVVAALIDVCAIEYSATITPLDKAREVAEVQINALMEWNKFYNGDITRGTVYTFHDFHLRAAELI